MAQKMRHEETGQGRNEMKLNDYTLARFLCTKCPSFVASLVMSFTFVACNATSPNAPVLPSAQEESAAAVNTAPPCPSFNEACATGRELVASACPADGKYKKPGDYKKCRRHTLDSYLKGLSSCFSQSQQNEIRRCILASFPLVEPSSGGTGKARFHSDE
jgi:hypothetical protein